MKQGSVDGEITNDYQKGFIGSSICIGIFEVEVISAGLIMIIDMEMAILVFWAIRTSLLTMDVDSTGLTMILGLKN